MGANIVQHLHFPWPVREIVLQHHERMDGTGYPAGLKGEEISEAARIVAVADVAESMSAHRPYRPALGTEAAIRELVDGRGCRYDARIVDAFLKLVAAGQTLPEFGGDSDNRTIAGDVG
jgi:HD-GYP domain-containing protein (c-di-GMP phosphodiesterase class II)